MSLPVKNILTYNALAILALIFIILWHPLNEFVAEPETLALEIV